MSLVTNLIVSFSASEDEASRIKEVNWFRHQGRELNLSSANFSVGGMKWYDGSKNMDTPLYIGVYNHFNLDEFIRHLSDLDWIYPERVQVIFKGEEDNVFRIHNLVSRETKNSG